MEFSTSPEIVENSLMSMPDWHDARSVWDRVHWMMRKSGWNSVSMSRHGGHHDAWMREREKRGSLPHLDEFCDMADACGYELVLRRKRGAL
jgi:hypothetical protein